MATVILTSIEVDAFKAFVAPARVDVDALTPGLHLVRGHNLTNDRLGSNGAGKSTFFADAPTWVLYGKTIKNRPTTAVRPWRGKKSPAGALTFLIDGSERVLIREVGAQGLTVDGQVIGPEDGAALVGMDFATWSQAIVYGQGRPLFFDLPPRDKMALLSDALGLERWERRAQAAGARAKRLEDRLRGLEGEVRGLEAAREHAQDALDRARDASDEWGRGQTALIEETASAARSARQAADSLETKRGEAALAADSAGMAAKMGRPAVDALRAEAGELVKREIKARQEADQASREQRLAEVALAAFAEDGRCPTCGQTVAKKDAALHIKNHQVEIARLVKLIKKLERTEASCAEQAAAKAEQLEQESERLNVLESLERQAESELRLLDRELGAAQAKAAAAWDAHERAKAEVNPHRQAAQDARKRLRAVALEIKEKGELSAKLSASVERAQLWARGFRDIRLGIIDDVLDDLRGTTAEVLDGLGLGEWGVEYATERETKSGTTQRALHVMVASPTSGEAKDWDDWSGGEGQRLRLAGALALSEVLLAHAGTALDFRVLDEPTRGLSAEGVRDLVEVLGDYARAAGLKIFFIDHMAIDGAGFASTVTVTNDGDGARVD